MIPFNLLIVSLFFIIIQLGLKETYWGAIIPLAASPIGLFFMRVYCMSVNDEMIDSARVDGANEYRIFWSIALPNLRPGLATLFILFALEYWNNLLWPLIVFLKKENLPLAVGPRRHDQQLPDPVRPRAGRVGAGDRAHHHPVLPPAAAVHGGLLVHGHAASSDDARAPPDLSALRLPGRRTAADVRPILGELAKGLTQAIPRSDPRTLIDPVLVAVLREEIREFMCTWGSELLGVPERYANRFYQGFIVLQSCRMWCDVETGTVGSKPRGTAWAKERLDPRWHDLIDRAWATRTDPAVSVRTPADAADLARTLDFVRPILADLERPTASWGDA